MTLPLDYRMNYAQQLRPNATIVRFYLHCCLN